MQTLTQRQLNRALLARQLLLERAALPLPAALSQVAGIQAQYAPSTYIGLWSRLTGFERGALDAALEDRSAIQGTLMRGTIHVVGRDDYWPFALATRAARREMFVRSRRGDPGPQAMAAAARTVRRALAGGGSLQRKEIDALVGKPRAQGVGLWVDLIRVPPSGTWNRRRADLYALAEDWVGPPAVRAPDAAAWLVRRYLAGFGPASRKDVANFTGIALGPLARVLDRLELRRFVSEAGEELLDVMDGALPDPDVPAPPRFLGTWDANLLVHARRTGVLPEEYRPKLFSTRTPHSFPSFVVDGAVAGTWRFVEGVVELAPFAPLAAGDEEAVRAEAARLAAFHA